MNTWKCYRCNLSFKKEVHAEIHQEITNHTPRPIEFIKS